MFKKFLSKYNVSSQVKNKSDLELLSKIEPYSKGFTSLMSSYGGSTFENGMYRLHAAQDVLKWTQIVEEVFVDYSNRTVCFGYDWLGRHFALDKSRTEQDQMLILMLEPGAGEVMQIPVNFYDFHNQEVIEYQGDALASDFYLEWVDNKGERPKHSECIGYKIPLFLNGNDTIENLELSDMEVYWSICGQTLNSSS